jgi:hypothetical protein
MKIRTFLIGLLVVCGIRLTHIGAAAVMPSESLPNEEDACELEAAIDQAITACDGDFRATIGALIVANSFLESEVDELKKAVSHAMRGRFQTYAG